MTYEEMCRELLAERFGKLVPEYKNTPQDDIEQPSNDAIEGDPCRG